MRWEDKTPHNRLVRIRNIDIHVRALLSASHKCRFDRWGVSRFFMDISHLCLMKDIKVAGHSWEAEEGGTHVETRRDTNGRMFSQFCDRMYAHVHKLHNDPAKTSWTTDVIKCWQDCCVPYSNAAMQSQRWAFRTMSSLINQTGALTMLPRWVSCCSLDVRKTFLENWQQQFTERAFLILISRLSHWQEMRKLHCQKQKYCDATIRRSCVAVCGFGVQPMFCYKKPKKINKDMSNHKILKIKLEITASCCASTSLKRYVEHLKRLKVKLECRFFSPSVMWT